MDVGMAGRRPDDARLISLVFRPGCMRLRDGEAVTLAAGLAIAEITPCRGERERLMMSVARLR